jgi:hypothetical protein
MELPKISSHPKLAAVMSKSRLRSVSILKESKTHKFGELFKRMEMSLWISVNKQDRRAKYDRASPDQFDYSQ